MNTASTTLEEVEPILIEFGQRHAVIRKLEIFGSLATGRATPESDLDVLVTFGPEAPTGFDYVTFIIDLREELERLVGRHVDLISRGSLNSDPFSYNANRQAKAVYERP